jgi:hypothetical protein
MAFQASTVGIIWGRKEILPVVKIRIIDQMISDKKNIDTEPLTVGGSRHRLSRSCQAPPEPRRDSI